MHLDNAVGREEQANGGATDAGSGGPDDSFNAKLCSSCAGSSGGGTRPGRDQDRSR